MALQTVQPGGSLCWATHGLRGRIWPVRRDINALRTGRARWCQRQPLRDAGSRQFERAIRCSGPPGAARRCCSAGCRRRRLAPRDQGPPARPTLRPRHPPETPALKPPRRPSWSPLRSARRPSSRRAPRQSAAPPPLYAPCSWGRRPRRASRVTLRGRGPGEPLRPRPPACARHARERLPWVGPGRPPSYAGGRRHPVRRQRMFRTSSPRPRLAATCAPGKTRSAATRRPRARPTRPRRRRCAARSRRCAPRPDARMQAGLAAWPGCVRLVGPRGSRMATRPHAHALAHRRRCGSTSSGSSSSKAWRPPAARWVPRPQRAARCAGSAARHGMQTHALDRLALARM